MCDKRNHFCYICGMFVDKKHRLEFAKSKAVVEGYNLLFERTYIESQWFEPEYVCSMCTTTIKKWRYEKRDTRLLPITIPMVWHYQKIHKQEDCYFCQTNITGHHYKTRDRIKYANVITISKPVLRKIQDEQISTKKTEDSSESSDGNLNADSVDRPYIPIGATLNERHLVSNEDYRDLLRDLGLSSRQTEILGSRLKQWDLVENGFKATFARDKGITFFEQLYKADDVDHKLSKTFSLLIFL